MKPINIEFTIEALEDFHIGTGIDCIGLYDDGQLKDKNQNPAIRPETLKGLIKQSAREINKAFNNKFQGAYEELFNFRNLGSLDVSADYVVPKNFTGTPFIIHRFTAIDSEKGKGLKGSLRDIEFGTKGSSFSCRIHFELKNGNNYKKVKDLLELSIKNLKWIGGSRRRGFGAVRCSDINEFTPESGSVNIQGSGRSFKLLLRLEDDVCFSGAGQTGNHINTLDYITGTTILGMLRNILLKKGEPADTEDFSLLDDPNVTVTNFYPIDCTTLDKSVVIPVPASLRKNKALARYKSFYKNQRSSGGEKSEFPHWALKAKPKEGQSSDFVNYVSQDTLIDTNAKDSQGDSDKSISNEYLIFQDKTMDWQTARFFKPETALVMRNTISPETQATHKDAVFTQDMIAKGTHFTGTITFTDPAKAESFEKIYHDWFAGNFNFHAGRGGKPVKVVDVKCHEAVPDPADTDENGNTCQNGDLFSITLVSDVILYDENLMPETVIHPHYLKLENKVTLEKQITSSRIHQSFSGTAGLLRFSDRVITKGSCFLYRLKNSNEKEDVQKILSEHEVNGIGFKRNEGFGRIAVNLSVHEATRGDFAPSEYTYTVKDAAIPSYMRNNLKTICDNLSKAEKYKDGYHPASKSFKNRIIAYMEAGIPEPIIQKEIDHNIKKQSSATDNWKQFNEKIWKKMGTDYGCTRDENGDIESFRDKNKVYNLIHLVHLLKKV